MKHFRGTCVIRMVTRAVCSVVAAAVMCSVAGQLRAQQSDPRERLAAAVALFEQKKHVEARVAIDALLGEYDTSENRDNIEFESLLAGGHYYLGEICLNEDKHLEAIGHYQETITAFHFFGVESRYHMGMARYYLKEYQTAIGILGDLASQYPSSALAPQALYYQGACHELLRDKAEAQAIYRTMIERYPQHAWTKKAATKISQ